MNHRRPTAALVPQHRHRLIQAVRHVTHHIIAIIKAPQLRRALYLTAMALIAGANAAATWTINHHTWPAAVLAITNALGSLLIITGTTELLRNNRR
jgi:hypothetical protein